MARKKGSELPPINRTQNKNTSRRINTGGVFLWQGKKEVKTTH
jgi:hypothetical protein